MSEGDPVLYISLLRYQSLQRSFRRSERPTVNVRGQSSVRGSEAPSRGGHGRGGASGLQSSDNNSLSLTLAEAEEMARGLSNKKRSGSGFSGRWFFSRKRKSSSPSQPGGQASSSTPPSSVEGSPQPEGDSSSPLSRSSGSDNQNEVAAMIVATARDRELTPASIQSSEFESGTDEEVFSSARSEARPEVATETTTPEGRSDASHEPSTPERSEVAPEPHPLEMGGETTLAPTASNSPGERLRGRQTSIVHASNLSTVDQVAASRARVAASNRRSRQRLNSDEVTNQGKEGIR